MIASSSARTRRLCIVVLFVVVSLSALTACGQPAGEELVAENCTGCHTEAIIEVSAKTAHEWHNTVYEMINLGADVNDDDAEALIEYLASEYGPESP
ncbi:MAG: hypothetical protein PVG11_09795 [Anaerolineae bacterium]|jgi:hypothetical protein